MERKIQIKPKKRIMRRHGLCMQVIAIITANDQRHNPACYCFLLLLFKFNLVKPYVMNKTTRILLGIGACVAIGAALGVLIAPEEGAETRKKLMKRARKLSGTVSDGIDKGRESLEEIKSTLQKELSKVNRKIEEIKF